MAAFESLRTFATLAKLSVMDDAKRARAKISEMLELALGGHVSFIETVRNVNRMVEAAGFDRLSEPFITMMGIESETDEIPLGKVRELWNPEAVEKHRADWDRAEAWAKQFGEQACRAALALVRQT